MENLPFKFMKNPPSYDAASVFYVRVDPAIRLTSELLKALYYMLWFPGYFGFNWDALHDCLTDFSWIECHKIVLVHEALPELPRDELKIYLEILRDSVVDWNNNDLHDLEVVFSDLNRVDVESILKV